MEKEFYAVLLASFGVCSVCANLGLYDNDTYDKLARKKASFLRRFSYFFFWHEIVIHTEYRKHGIKGRAFWMGLISSAFSFLYIFALILSCTYVANTFIENKILIFVTIAFASLVLSPLVVPLLAFLCTPLIMIISIPINSLYPLKSNLNASAPEDSDV